MSPKRGRRVVAFAIPMALAGPFATPALAFTQGFPSKPIELIVPFAAGGTNDVIARILGDGLAKELGQPIVILNKPGASAVLGTSYVARAKADGYTLLLGSQGTHSANPHLVKNLSYNPLKDFTPVAFIGKVNNVLVVPSSMPVRTLGEFVTYAKKNPGKVTFSHAGVGTSMSLAAELFKLKAGVDLLPIPYQGSAPATLAVVAGDVQAMFANTTSVVQDIHNGKLRPLGVTSNTRDPLLPDVKSIADGGIAGVDIQPWFGVFAPSGVPRDVVDRLTEAVQKVLSTSDAQRRLQQLGVIPGSLPAEAFRSFVQTDNAAIGTLIKQAGIKIE